MWVGVSWLLGVRAGSVIQNAGWHCRPRSTGTQWHECLKNWTVEVTVICVTWKMKSDLEKIRRREPRSALEYWRTWKTNISLISTIPIKKVTRASLSSRASYASAKRHFRELVLLEGRQRQSILSSTLETTEMVRVYSRIALQDNLFPKTGPITLYRGSI